MERAGHFLATGGSPTAKGSLLDWASPALALVPLAALIQVAQQLNEPGWEHTARHAAQQLRHTHDLTRWDMPLHLLMPVVEALLDLGWHDEAKGALQLAAAMQDATGNVPALPEARWVSSSGLAHLAACWYRLGEIARADAALAAVYRHQQPDGGFPGSWGDGAAYHPRRQTVATACFVLDAALAQVSSSFAQQRHPSNDVLSPEDGRLQAVRRALEELPPGSSVADVGCGGGRYLRWLKQWFPQLRWIAIDASSEALKRVPRDMERRQGSLLNLPATDGEFAAVFCVEALEHALLPEQAIAELCRVTRSGGRLLLIDKHRRFQPLSQHEPWEIWFTPAEVRLWLEPFCADVGCQPIAHGPRQRPTGLFLLWQARRSRSQDCLLRSVRDAA